jgi:UDP-N-acetylmuramoyl-tripeptide--D-alanyl-D-alanine ligase
MNPESARCGLQALAGLPGPGRRIVVFGEMLELGDQSEALHRALGTEVARSRVDCLLVVGSGAQPIAEGALAAGMAPRAVLAATDVAAALRLLLDCVREGDRVLCKASRRVALDRLVDQLVAQLVAQAGASPGNAVAVANGNRDDAAAAMMEAT